MRRALVMLLLPLAATVLALAPAGLAAEPLCAPSCEVPSTTQAFLPPATALTSGATVTWSSLDGLGHTATSDAFCIHVTYGATPGSATFTVRDGALWADSASRGLRACAEAVALPGGAFALPYVCLYHPMMKGELLVAPA